MKNSLAYTTAALITTVRSFIVQTPKTFLTELEKKIVENDFIKLFFAPKFTVLSNNIQCLTLYTKLASPSLPVNLESSNLIVNIRLG